MTPNDSLATADLVFWIEELRAGRPHNAEPQLRKILARVETLARAMFKRFPRVGRFVDVEDVIQNSLIRLMAAFRETRPTSRRHFYALVNTMIRRELLTLTERYRGPRDAAALDDANAPAVPDHSAELDRLAGFHDAVANLPPEEREVFGLSYYHGWTQTQIGTLFGVSVRTVQRWYESAIQLLRGHFTRESDAP